jgi:hypothetical protein
MNDSAGQWLTDHASLPGTLACGLRHPDGQFICRSLNKTFPAAVIEKILGGLDTLTEAASWESSKPDWSTWAFEQGQVRLVERPDGWRFALVVRNESNVAPSLDQLSREFLSAALEC